ncbi:MAG TPA: conjugative transposon protein TraM [Cyclobacteriaceae bacterium]|nr:conjugative transposon protein TraM [Cyclobacteriaceae bacterium]
MKKHSQQFLQKRKLAMALPMLTMPFLTLIFWALGGGQAIPGQAIAMHEAGLNLELPNAHFSPDEKTDKFSLYEESQRDSADFFEAVENDPYFELNTMVLEDKPDAPLFNGSALTKAKVEDIDPNEAKVNEKLELIYRELNRTPTETHNSSKPSRDESMVPPVEHEQFSEDVSKLESMMEMMAASEEPDPEMVQMASMLDKILDIQHPQRVKERLREQSIQHSEQVFSVSLNATDPVVDFIQPSVEASHTIQDTGKASIMSLPANGFYGLEEESQREQQDNAIPAVIHDTQELVVGATVKLRLTNDIYLNGQLIPKDQFIYGTASINEERLNITINSVRYENSLFPVALSVYDLDGMEGIYVPGAITRDVVKQSTDQGLQGMQFMSMDQTLAAQAASAGIEAAKGLFSKKVKLIKVTVKAGYQVLLKDTNAKQ